MVLTLGSDQRGEADNVRLTWNYRILVAEVAGTFAPTLGTGLFHGELQLGELWTTDTDLLTLTKPASNGDIAVSTFTGAFTDTQGSPTTRTYTATGRVNEVEIQWQKGNFIMASARVHELVSLSDATTTFP